jgi:hypothetical protein
MKTRLTVSGAAAFLCAGVLSAAQITPQGGVQQRPPQPTTQQPRPTASEGPSTTLTGCLYREDSIPGRTPNVAEKAGVLEDYILADARTARDPSRLPDRPVAGGAPPSAGDTAGLATGRMYKVTKIDDERLKPLIGKRVEVTGTIKPDDDARPDQKPASFQNLPNIEGTFVREASGAPCPATPAAAR